MASAGRASHSGTEGFESGFLQRRVRNKPFQRWASMEPRTACDGWACWACSRACPLFGCASSVALGLALARPDLRVNDLQRRVLHFLIGPAHEIAQHHQVVSKIARIKGPRSRCNNR